MKFGLPDHSIALIHTVLAKCERVEKAILYGSRAKGNFRKGSDIDLVLVGDSLTTTDLMTIADALDDSMLPYTADVSLLHQLNHEDLKAHIARVGKVFYERCSVLN